MKVFSIIFFCILIGSCSVFKKAGSNLGEGLNTQTKRIAQNLVSGLHSGITDSAFRTDLYKMLDSAITVAGTSTNKNLKSVLDSILTERWSVITRQLVEDATGQHTLENVQAIRESLIGAQTKAEVQDLIAAVLNDENTGKLIALKNELTGEETRNALTQIVDSAMLHLTNRFQESITDSTLSKLSRFLRNDVHESINTNLSVVQKYATWFLTGIGLVTAFIITIVWINRQKYLKLSTLLASHVNAIPDRQVYDELTARIKQSAVTEGVEPALRNILDKNKLLGKETWKPVS